MAKPDIILIDGQAYSWRQLVERRRQQIEAWRDTKPQQLALFELREDCRPPAERTAAGRYREPTLLALMIGEQER
jgi:hypothetical protein